MLNILIPCFNEEKVIKKSIEKILNWSEAKDFYVQLIIINNNSTDKTLDELRSFKNIENILITEETNKGKGYAIKKGLIESQFNNILILDADLSTDVDQFKDKWLKENELLILGSRPLGNEFNTPIKRRIAGKVFNFILRKTFNFKILDTQCGFKYLTTQHLEEITKEISTGGFLYDLDIILSSLKHGVTIKEEAVDYYFDSDSSVSLIKDSILMLKDMYNLKQKYS